MENKFFDQQRDLDLLRYYLGDALRLFVEGDYEMAFISGYKVINEETIVNPRDYVSVERKGKPSFSEVRALLMHSRRKRTQIDVKRIKETKRNLPQDCLELLERCFTLLKRIEE